MWGQHIDLPPDSAPWLYAEAGPTTSANEQSISLSMDKSRGGFYIGRMTAQKVISGFEQ